MQDGNGVIKTCRCLLKNGKEKGRFWWMKADWRRVNWTGILGAVILFCYGWMVEPLAAVLGGMILLTDFLTFFIKK